MNVLVIGKFYAEGFALHITETLEALGHSVRRFSPGLATAPTAARVWAPIGQAQAAIFNATDSVPAIRARRMRALWAAAGEQPLDLVIVSHDFLWPAEVSELKRSTGAVIALWFPDHLANFGKGFFMTARYDALFFKDPYIPRALKSVLKTPVYYLPECFNPARHSLPEAEIGNDPAYACDITTAGNSHSWRVAFYENLAEYDVKLWGNPPPLWMDSQAVSRMHQRRPVYNHEKVRAFRGAKIVVNNLHYAEIWGLNARTFEAAGAGAFQMVDWRPGIRQLFEDRVELVTFRGVDDLKKSVNYWLPRADARHEVAERGRLRAHSEHTYALRLQLLLDTVAGRENGFPLPSINWLD